MKTTTLGIPCDNLAQANQVKRFFETGEGVAPMNVQRLKDFRTPGAVIKGEVVGKNPAGKTLLVLTKTEQD